jgi:protease-4
VDGIIATGSGGGFASAGIASSGAASRAVRRAADDATVKAIVLRVNSPGGSALASDIIWRAVVEAAEVKPVVASMGSVAASGGYYVAMGADHILAEPGSVTGSVGVFGGKFDLGGLYAKIGVRREVITRGRNATIYGDVGGFTDTERERVGAIIDEIYRDFVSKAATSRDMSYEDMEALARGQVWTGGEAESHGLIDELGGLRQAFAAAKVHAGYSEDRQFELLELPREPSLWDMLDTDGWSWASRLPGAAYLAHLDAWRALADERAIALIPFDVSFQ